MNKINAKEYFANRRFNTRSFLGGLDEDDLWNIQSNHS